MKRANGTGSVYKRSDFWRRRNPYIAVVYIGHDKMGRVLRKSIGSFPTASAAQKALEAYNVLPKPAAGRKRTVAEVWDYARAQKEKKRPISRTYESAWRAHIEDTLGLVPIEDIKTMDMQRIIDSCPGKSRQDQLITIFHAVFNYAIANDLVVKDYSRFLKATAVRGPSRHRPFTSEEMRILWQHTDEDFVKVILMQIYTGTRQIEITSMKRENVHLKERYMIGGVKTAAGRNRIIPIAECIVPFVQYFYHISCFQNSDILIVPDPPRKLYSLRGLVNMADVYRRFLPTFIKAPHTSHDGRHTFVTMADNYDMNTKTLKLIVGHAFEGDVTKDVYMHKNTTQLIDAVNTLPWGDKMCISPEELKQESGRNVDATP